MAYEIPGFKISLVAGEDLSAKQFYFVKLNTSGQAVLPSATTDRPIGILQNKPGSLGVAEIMVSGVSKLVTGSNLAKADPLGTDAAGKGTTYAYGVAGTAAFIVGQVLVDNSAVDGISTVLFDCKSPNRGF